MLGQEVQGAGSEATAPDLLIRISPLHFMRLYLASLVSGVFLVRPVYAITGRAVLTFGAIALATIATVVLFAVRIRVRVQGDEVVHRGWRGTSSFQSNEVDRVFAYSFAQLRGPGFRLYVIRGNSGQCLLSLFGMVWRDSDLDRLSKRLDLAFPGWPSKSSYGEARRDCPAGGLPMFVQHPVSWILYCIPVALALSALVVWLVVR